MRSSLKWIAAPFIQANTSWMARDGKETMNQSNWMLPRDFEVDVSVSDSGKHLEMMTGESSLLRNRSGGDHCRQWKCFQRQNPSLFSWVIVAAEQKPMKFVQITNRPACIEMEAVWTIEEHHKMPQAFPNIDTCHEWMSTGAIDLRRGIWSQISWGRAMNLVLLSMNASVQDHCQYHQQVTTPGVDMIAIFFKWTDAVDPESVSENSLDKLSLIIFRWDCSWIASFEPRQDVLLDVLTVQDSQSWTHWT
jgi:hypothetical protein